MLQTHHCFTPLHSSPTQLQTLGWAQQPSGFGEGACPDHQLPFPNPAGQGDVTCGYPHSHLCSLTQMSQLSLFSIPSDIITPTTYFENFFLAGVGGL